MGPAFFSGIWIISIGTSTHQASPHRNWVTYLIYLYSL
jgi:hypothetical protein